jgi:hypothetical protein
LQEIFIKGLANSKAFQKFAVRTDYHLRSFKEGGVEHLNSKLDELHKAATEAAFSANSARSKSTSSRTAYHTSGPPVPPKGGFMGFLEAFGKEVKKDLGLGK